MYDLKIEKNIFKAGQDLIGAIDEVGRGPLAGPVVAACVLISPEFKFIDELKEVKDSKKLSEKKRNQLYNVILNSFLEVGVGICDQDTIDRINILNASYLAMKKALGSLKRKPTYLLIDGKNEIPNISIKQQAIIKGDDKVFSISAASIIAKVTRDNIMIEHDKQYPLYGFSKHKGYGTKDHLISLKKIGPCPLHRKSFKPIKKYS